MWCNAARQPCMEGGPHDGPDRDHAQDGQRSKILSPWWRSCTPITPSTARCFNGVNNGKRHASLGLLATLPRKSIEPMVLAVDGVAPKAVRAMQSFMSEGQWHDERLLHQHWKEVATDLGAADGVLMVDGSDFPKQGVHSVGVKRQYCGELGKRANCQAGVFVGSVRPRATPCWIGGCMCPRNGSPTRRMRNAGRQCGLPAETTCKTKPELAQEMICYGGPEPGAAVSVGGSGRGMWGQPRLSGWRSGAGPVVFC